MHDGCDLRKADTVLSMLPEAIMVTDCKSLYDALARSESQGLGLSEKRTAIEVAATRQQMEATGVNCRWVNSDRQLADSLTKPMLAHAMTQLCRSGYWKIVFDETFTSAKKVKRMVRDEAWKKGKGTGPSKTTSQGKAKGSGKRTPCLAKDTKGDYATEDEE